MPHYRVTRPELYSKNTPGHTDKSARQGHYTDAENEEHARELIRLRMQESDERILFERLDVQLWRP